MPTLRNAKTNPRNDRRLREFWDYADDSGGRYPPTPLETATRLGLMLAIALAVGLAADMAIRLAGG